MAKELPYFKFEPNQWENGTIQMCSFEAQGVFISVCSMYWQRLGDLPYKLAVGKICKGNATPLDSLIEDGIIKLIDGHICIDFLNEQLSGFASISEINSKNAREGWEKRRKDATPLPPHSEPNAIREEKKIEEERKKEDKKEDPLRALVSGWANEGLANAWFDWLQYKKESKKKLTLSTAKAQLKFLGGRPDSEAIAILNQSITSGWTGLFELKQNGKLGNNGKSNKRSSDAIIEPGKDFGSFA